MISSTSLRRTALASAALATGNTIAMWSLDSLDLELGALSVFVSLFFLLLSPSFALDRSGSRFESRSVKLSRSMYPGGFGFKGLVPPVG